jgi:hypothetical protein
MNGFMNSGIEAGNSGIEAGNSGINRRFRIHT